MDRVEIIQQLLNRRFSYQEIGNELGVSRQRVHQIIKNYSSPCNKPLSIFKKKITEFEETQDYFSADLNSCNIGGVFITEEIKEKIKGLQGKDRLREIVRIRDDHTCQICGRVWEKNKRRFDVHHTDKEVEGKKAFIYSNNKDFSKMITLCHKCHLNLDSVRKKMAKTTVNYSLSTDVTFSP